jgi:hypothetical protein
LLTGVIILHEPDTLKEASEQHSLASAGNAFYPDRWRIRFPRHPAVWSPRGHRLKLNVVVVCAVFLFVGAILIGAF